MQQQQAVGRFCEALKLEWYFSRGQCAFERSASGATYERAQLYSVSREYRAAEAPVYGKQGQVIGTESGITARPTAELQQPVGYTPDLKVLRDFAIISARMKRLDRKHARVLELLYGDHGQRWIVDGEPWGRLGSLFHMTAKGRQMLTAARKVEGALSRPDTERMLVFAAVHGTRPTAESKQAFACCQAQALVLEAAALDAWRALGGSS